MVFTSYGAITWLPDLNPWAEIISRFLNPGGCFIMAEFHPLLWMFDEDFQHIRYSYFQKEPMEETVTTTYTGDEKMAAHQLIYWQHNLGEIISSLTGQQLEITAFKEFDYSPYNCFSNMVEPEAGKYRVRGMESNLPMVFSLKATKKFSS